MVILEIHTDALYISVYKTDSRQVFIAEAFIKMDGFVWHSVRQYQEEPSKESIVKDIYLYGHQSCRPYMAGQPCDGSISACVFHLYEQLCIRKEFDPVELYKLAYEDDLLTADELSDVIFFAAWQGIEQVKR